MCYGVLMFGFVHVLLRIISRVLVDRVFSAVGVGGLIATGYGEVVGSWLGGRLRLGLRMG